MKKITHLNALQAFEAVARLGSYKDAADELAVSPEAIGQQIRKIEEYFSCSLFERDRRSRRMAPSKLAKNLIPELSSAFNLLRHCESKLRDLSNISDTFSLSVSPSVASKIIIPHFAELKARLGTQTINLDITSNLTDIDSDEVNMAIRYGPWREDIQNTVLLLKDEQLLPVCTPDYYQKLISQQENHKLSIIIDATIKQAPFEKNIATFLKACKQYQNTYTCIEANSAVGAMDALMHGEGLGLVRARLARREIDSGRLKVVRELAQDYVGWSYYILYKSVTDTRSKNLITWLSELFTV